MPTQITIESVILSPPRTVWAAVRRTDTLAAVARPLLVFRPAPGQTLPEQWPVGVPVQMRLWAFGAVPLGPHTLFVESADDEAMTVQTRELSPLLRRWDHRITVAPSGPEHALYADEVEIDAGMFTPVVAAVARLFFRHRHRRWQALARRLTSDGRSS